MESVALPELLKIVQDIAAQNPLLSAKLNQQISPSTIPPLPQWSKNLPESALPLPRAVERLTNDILPYLNAQSLSSRYYGFVTGGVTPAALLADMVVPIFDQNVAVHLPKETISTNVEVAALNMLVDLCNLPTSDWAVGTSGNGGGHFTSGATGSNILGLALGREYILSRAVMHTTGKSMSVGQHGLLEVCRAGDIDKVIVLSTMAHSSTIKAASVVGLGRSSVISISKPDDPLDIDLNRLRRLAESSKQDRIAYILAISASEVNTGRFDVRSKATMTQIREICDKHDIWLHVDAAMGLFARILLGQPQEHEYSHILEGVKGMELADSITSDGHKLLNVPYDCGIFFTRHKKLSEQVFMNGNAAYLKTEGVDGDHIQTPLNIGLENSRRFRALPVYLTLSAYGREGYVDMLKRQIDLARKTVAWLWDNDKFEVLPKQNSKEEAIANTYMIVLFRPKDSALSADFVERVNCQNKIYISGTQWDGKNAARIAISNWRVNPEEDFAVIQEVLSSAVQQ